jgi:hypothetical protein
LKKKAEEDEGLWFSTEPLFSSESVVICTQKEHSSSTEGLLSSINNSSEKCEEGRDLQAWVGGTR